MKFDSGLYKLQLPIPKGSFKKECMFTFSSDSSVGNVLNAIKEEESSQQVSIKSQNTKVEHQCDLTEFLKCGPFELFINEKKMHVIPPENIEQNPSSFIRDDGVLDVVTLLSKAPILKLRKFLETDPRWKTSYDEYVSLCHSIGIPKMEANSILRHLHQLGIVFHFSKSKDDDVRNTIFLKPQEIVDDMYEKLDLVAPTRHSIDFKKLEEQIALFEPEYVALSKLDGELKRKAEFNAKMISCFMTGATCTVFGVYFWLSFIHFSWDIMEPVTYFSGFGVSILAYFWWSVTNSEYEYENIYDYFYKSSLHKIYDQQLFDPKKLAALHSKLTHYKKQLEILKLSPPNAQLIESLLNDNKE